MGEVKDGKKLKILTILFCIIKIGLMIFNIHSKEIFPHYKKKYYEENWMKGPIIEIYTKKKNDNNELLINYTFGYNEHFICDDKKVYNKDQNNKCIKYEKKNFTITKWRGTELYVKRISNFEYLKKLSHYNTNSYFKCSHSKSYSKIDSENLLLCNNSDNIITNITITNNNESKSNNSIELDNGNYLNYNSIMNNNTQILVSFELSQNKNVCSHPLEGNLGISNFSFSNLKYSKDCISKFGNVTIDNRYINIDNMTLKELLESNGINITNNSISPYYLQNLSEIVYLNYHNYFGINHNKINEPIFLDKIINELEGDRGFYISLIVFESIRTFFFILLLCRIEKEENYDDLLFYLFIFYTVIVTIFCYIELGFTITCFFHSSSFVSFYDRINDPITKNVIQYGYLQMYNKWCMVLFNIFSFYLMGCNFAIIQELSNSSY